MCRYSGVWFPGNASRERSCLAKFLSCLRLVICGTVFAFQACPPVAPLSVSGYEVQSYAGLCGFPLCIDGNSPCSDR